MQFGVCLPHVESELDIEQELVCQCTGLQQLSSEGIWSVLATDTSLYGRRWGYYCLGLSQETR